MTLKDKMTELRHRVLWSIALGLVEYSDLNAYGYDFMIGDEIVTGIVEDLVFAGLCAFVNTYGAVELTAKGKEAL